MKVGTKSILFGVHQCLIHPWFVALAWWKLYGFPWDIRLWVAFFVHDLGYFGKPNMDGPEGEIHPWFGARIMTWLFDREPHRRKNLRWITRGYSVPDYLQEEWVVCFDPNTEEDFLAGPWGQFCFYHSRFLAKSNNMPFSRLCVADKLSFALTPRWLYLPLARMSGEIHEYMKHAKGPRNLSMQLSTDSQKEWWDGVAEYLIRWCEEHKDGRFDNWTPNLRQAG